MDKIQEAIQKNILFLSGYGASERAVKECEAALLDAIIEEMEEEITTTERRTCSEDDQEWKEGYLTAYVGMLNSLKQARSSLTDIPGNKNFDVPQTLKENSEILQLLIEKGGGVVTVDGKFYRVTVAPTDFKDLLESGQ